MNAIDHKTVAVVTGASAGVGRALVRTLGDRGASVALLARGRDGLEAAKKEVEQRGGRALVVPTDVSKPEQVEAAARAAESQLGPVDLWVNVAMVSMYSPFIRMTPDEFKHIVEVTFLGNVYGTRAALDRMIPRDRGVIIQVGSALAFRSIPLQSAYCASKHAIKGFTESVRSELIHQKSNVRISTVNLPALNTTQFRWTKNKMPNKARRRERFINLRLPPPALCTPPSTAGGKSWSATPPPRRRWARRFFPACWIIIWPVRHGKVLCFPSRLTRSSRTTSGRHCPATLAATAPSIPRRMRSARNCGPLLTELRLPQRCWASGSALPHTRHDKPRDDLFLIRKHQGGCVKSRILNDAHGEKEFALIFDAGDDVMAELKRFAAEQPLAGAHFTGIGALARATVGWFDLDRQEYQPIEIDEQVELLSFTGDIAEGPNGKPAVHAHLVVGKRDGTAHGGHLIKATVRPTLELVLTETPAHLRKTFRRQFGIALIDLEKH